MHLAPKQILVNAHVSLKNHLTTEEIVKTIGEIEKKIKEAEPKVDMIFLETASLKEDADKVPIPSHFRLEGIKVSGSGVEP